MNPIAARRLAAQQIVQPRFSKASDLVAWLGAVQAQDYAGAKWALGLRLRDPIASDESLEQAVDDGTILRTHAMRWTWQFVHPDDVRWMLALVASRLATRSLHRDRQLELDAAMFRRTGAALEKALRDGQHLTRKELGSALQRARISVDGQRLAYILGRAELDAIICSGKRRGKQHTYTLLDRRVPLSSPTLDRDQAIAELARRYFQSRGPATVNDFCWWSGLTMSDARAGIESIESTLVSDIALGKTFWRERGTVKAPRSPVAHLLPAFDEYLVAYRNRDSVLDPKLVSRVNVGGGMLPPCVVLDGRVIGTWRRALGRTSVAIELQLFERISPRAKRAIAVAARRYGAFLGLEVEPNVAM